MDINTYAFILLIIRLVSMTLMGVVLYKQLKLFKLPISEEIRNYRIMLFILALGIFLGNIIPAAIDILTMAGEVTRSTQIVNDISVLYTMDAAGTALLSSIMIFSLYRNALKADRK